LTTRIFEAVVAVAVSLTFVVAPSVASEHVDNTAAGDLFSNPKPPIETHRLAAASQTFGLAGRGPDTVRVEVLVDPDSESSVADLIDDVGGRIVGSAPGVLLADLPATQASSLASSDDAISNVRDPEPINLPPGESAISTAAVGAGGLPSLVGADAWHAKGYTGAGIRVGIIDYFGGEHWASAQAAGTVPAVSGVFCRNTGSSCDLWSAGDAHGVAVAEAIHAVAPDAQLYLATVVTTTDLAAAVSWFDANGVTIVNRSLVSVLDSQGNGTGPQNAVVNDAVARGMAWFNAAGNHASVSGTQLGKYWRGTWVDGNGNGWLDFAPGDETLGMFCLPGFQGFRWSDWSGNATDYDVYVIDTDGIVLLGSESDQTTGAQPLEFTGPQAIDCDANPVVYLAVRLFSPGNGPDGDVLEFMYNGDGLEYSQNPYSVASPVADSANSGVMVVGAIDPGDGTAIGSYSSRGPTNDNRTKPDVVAPSCYPSVVYVGMCFNGTSGATPVAAGAAAILVGSGMATTPSAISSYIRSHAIDRGAAGTDNVYGAGQLKLGAPPVPLGVEAHNLGFVDPGQGLWHLFDGSGKQVKQFYFGNPGDYPILGDWNCDGIETVGMYRQSDGYVYLRNSNTQGNADIRFFFGDPGDVPVAGDFDGDGCGTVSIYRPSNQKFYIINKLGKNDGGLGAATTSYVFGNPGDNPFVGDFDGDGLETVGLHRESTGLVYFRNSHTQGNADVQFIFGDPGDRLVAGDWNDTGIFSPALFRPSNNVAYFRFTNSQGNADAQFHPAGSLPNWLPVAGRMG
jgi:Subtilase family